MNNTRLKLIINPNSGKGKAGELTERIVKMFEEASFDVQLFLTEKRNDAKDFAKNIGDENLIVCMGGDGTLHEVINGVMERGEKIPIGYIPMGSVNDFARSLKIPRKWEKAVKNIISGKDVEIDVGKFNNTYFSYVAAAGIFTSTSYKTSQKLKNKFGKLAYLLLGIQDLFEYRKMHLKIEVDGIEYDDDYLFVAACNTKSMGSIVKFKDEFVQLNDGNLDLLLIKYTRNIFQLAKGVRDYNKKRWNTDLLKFIHAREIKVYDRNNVTWTLDGEGSEFLDDASNVSHISIINKGLIIRTNDENI